MKIAIIGSGISGLTCGHLLHKQHDITLFEANDYIGGHTHTVDVSVANNTYAIDTGFIVFNDRTYPLFLRLLSRIGITPQPTDMSFSVHHSITGLEYNGHDLDTLFAQRSNLFSPQFYRFIAEIMRFNKQTKADLAQNNISDRLTLGEYLEQHQFSEFFCQHYVLPMGAAIWSASINDIRAFPLSFFLTFFNNHGLLSVTHRPQWYVIPGGSRSYIAPLTYGWREKIHLSTPVQAVHRTSNKVQILTKYGEQCFDEVIFACHSDQALVLLTDATEEEKKILSDISYRTNDVTLHTDVQLLPKRKKAWASWNYLLDNNHEQPALVTYDMNRLQHVESQTRFCITLNRSETIHGDKIIQQFNYAHPQFTLSAINAQKQRHLICGKQHTHFCGAYWYNGFHEDGVRSANDVCSRFGEML